MILTDTNLSSSMRALKREGKKIVLVTGFFDLIHIAHLNFLKAAKSEGDILLVGVESDARARQKKGEGRPIFSQQERIILLEELRSVDYVYALPDAFSEKEVREAFIQDVSPDILAVSESSPHQKAKAELLSKFGIELKVVYPHAPSHSTSSLIDKIRSLKTEY